MKADYMRYIYECLSGDNGLLVSTDEILGQKTSFKDLLLKRQQNEIEGGSAENDDNYSSVDCDVCNPSLEHDQMQSNIQNRKPTFIKTIQS